MSTYFTLENPSIVKVWNSKVRVKSSSP